MPEILYRQAIRSDLETIVAMFADDKLGKNREDASLPLNRRYTEAFAALDGDPNQYMLVGDRNGEVVAYLQITFMQHLSRLGSIRGQVESVRVRSDLRGQGIGKQLMQESIRLCRERGCSLVQLTTDLTREQTRKFYEDLGFKVTHHGMKMGLDQ